MKTTSRYSDEYIEQPVILERPLIWSRVLVWLIIGVAVGGLGWSAVAQIEQAVPAVGKLEPQDSTNEVKSPTSGVIKALYVKEGDKVKKGDILAVFDPEGPQADVGSLTKVRDALVRESQFYGDQVNGASNSGRSDLAAIVRLKDTLIQENQYLKAQLDGYSPGSVGSDFGNNQQQLLAASRAEYQSRVAAAQLKTSALEKQLRQTEEAIASIQTRMSNTQRNLATAQKNLEISTAGLARLSPLVTQGAVSQLQKDRLEQEVLSRQQDVVRFEDDLDARQAEVQRLQLEGQRLRDEMAQAREAVSNTVAVSAKDILTRIADNQKRIAEIDTQLSRSKLDNQKRLAEIDGELVKAKQSLQYRELRAPVDGVVFDIKAGGTGYVAQATETLMTIVPNDNLIAKVYLTNRDIGFVKEGMPVEVDVASFPATEFGTITGQLMWIGSDALPPEQIRPYYSFPAKIHIDKQAFNINGKQLPLQSGMEVRANIKIRKRTVLSLFTDWFDKKIRGLENVR